MSNKKNIIIAIVLLQVFAQSCKNGKKEISENTISDSIKLLELNEVQYKNADVKIDTAIVSGLSGIIKVNGVIDVPPQNMVSVSLPMGGYLQRTKLLPGMHLNKGEIIAVLEDQQYIQLQQDFLTAKAKFAYIEKEYLRQAELNTSKASSDKNFEMAKADYISQKIMINALSEKLKLISIDPKILNENTISKSINIYSPINGYVSKVNVNIGRYINPSDVMFELVNPDDIHLNLTIYEKDLQRISIGGKVMAYTNTNPEKKYLCDVILIGQDVTMEGYVQVHCHFETYSNILIPGMYMNADVETKSTSVYVIPEAAIVSSGGKAYVFIQKAERKFEMKMVKTGDRANGMVELLDKSLIGEKIVVSGAYDMLMMLTNAEVE